MDESVKAIKGSDDEHTPEGIVDKTIETVTLKVDMAEVLPNFRRGDMVYLYQYNQE